MSTSGLWSFTFNGIEMDDQTLEDYQQKLLEMRDKYQEKVENVTGCHFYKGEQPPEDNIFASFLYDCKRHHPKCEGWYLLWNPNLSLNKKNLKSSLHNHCALWQYKSISKKIQFELVHSFGKYFEMFDDDDTHPYYIDTFYNLNYGFKADDDELPEYTSFSFESPDYSERISPY